MWSKIAQLAIQDFLPIVVQALADHFTHKASVPAVATVPTAGAGA